VRALLGLDIMATITVTNSNDSGAGSLRAALAAAKNGDTINFAPSVSTIDLASSLVITKNVTIEGSQPGSTTPGVTVNGGGATSNFSDVLPVCIKAGALDEKVPRRDLWISPHHAMYLDGILIEARDLINAMSIVQAEHAGTVEYFHVELETHDVIIAEGALSETYLDEDNRAMFHNARDYEALYPAVAAVAPYCAPRLEDGYEVERVRQRLALRTGVLRALPRAAS
jgi:hypothetical protein